ncbi:Uncharacterised protein [uncultured Clostridium sp.]|nr:Uncharacterised protein [uncultured Clostridium sp.]
MIKYHTCPMQHVIVKLNHKVNVYRRVGIIKREDSYGYDS